MKLEARVERLEAAAEGSGDEGREAVMQALHRLTIEELEILHRMAEIEEIGGGPEEWPDGAEAALRTYEAARIEVINKAIGSGSSRANSKRQPLKESFGIQSQ